MKKLRNYLLFISCLILTILLAGCTLLNPEEGGKTKPEKEYATINLYSEYGELEKTKYQVEVGLSFTFPVLEQDGYLFQGWGEEGKDGYINTYSPKTEEERWFYAVWELDTDNEEAKELFLQINAIKQDQIRSTWLPRLNELKARYDALDAKYQAKVTNINTLISYIERATNLINAEPVIEAIDALPNKVTLADEDEVNRCNNLYLALTEGEKALVTNYDTVTKALARIEAIKSESYQYPDLINNLILKLPYQLTYDYYEDATYILSLYDSLDATGIELIDHPELITKLRSEVATFDASTDLIYCLGRDVYASRDDFGSAWFSDLYEFILYNGGYNKLTSEGINSVEDFVRLAHDYNAGNGQMRYLGNTFSQWYLAKDVNGILANQPQTAFLGYCYQNDRYMDYLPFLIRFFAYWRIDEKYANLSNYGADTFADRWATLVDTCKFFYYDVNTSYVKTARMQDCFNYCTNVCYCEWPDVVSGTITLPTNVTRRGYTFLGWYDNPSFTGSPITSVNYQNGKIVVYAKWAPNQTEIDTDAAAFVDVYIYNLTTDQAVINDTTVGYVMDMYDALSASAKAQVTRYSQLQQIYNSLNSTELTDTKVINVTYLGIDERSFSELTTAFLEDYNNLNGTTITDYNYFVTNRYSQMANMRAFYLNDHCYTKWSWLFNYLAGLDVARGVKVQANRALNRVSGDTEYLLKAIAYYFTKADATGDSEVAYNFSNASCETQMQVTYTYTEVTNLPELVWSGYTFLGFYSDQAMTNKITVVTDETPTVLYACFSKN